MNYLQISILPFLLSTLLFTFLPFLPAADCHGTETETQARAERTLRLLLVPEKNTFDQRRRYRYITDYLSRKMEMNVTVEIMANYGEISVAFQEGRADAGFFGSFSYALTHAQTGIEPLVRPVWLDGSSSYRGTPRIGDIFLSEKTVASEPLKI